MNILLGLGVLGATVFLGPAVGEAQTSRGSSVGIVTTLNGQATVTRADRPAQAVPLKFKDEVYFKDRISTKEHSIARVLLGGKSLVTVRELSDLTITEEPGRPSILDLFGGKIALAVAKLRMRPGESIEVRTPNAVAAVRGTVLVVDVTGGADATAKPRLTSFHAGPTPVQSKDVQTTFYNISTSPDSVVDVMPLSGKTATPNGVTLGPGQFVISNIFGLGQPGTMTDAQKQQATGGLLPRPQSGGSSQQLNQQLVDKTANTLGGGNAQALQTGGVGTGPLIIQNPVVILPTTGCEPNCAPPSGGSGGGGGGGGSGGSFTGHLTPCDDCTTSSRFTSNVPGANSPGAPVPLGFTFPFSANGQNYNLIEISSNGFIYLIDPANTGAHSSLCCNGNVGSLLASPVPMIAAFWTDLFPTEFVDPNTGAISGTGTVTFTPLGNRAVVGWNNVSECCNSNGGTTVTAQLLQNGQIIFTYSSINILGHTTLVGVSPGGSASDPGPTVFSSLDSPTGRPGTVYQVFSPGTFDLVGHVLMFTPNGNGGWLVVDPPPPYLVAVGNGEVVMQDRPLLEATGGSQLLIGGAALIENGQLIVTDPRPLVSLTGGSHYLGIFPGTAMFDLIGSATAIDGETGLEVGTLQPLQHAGEMLRLDHAVASGEQLVRIDRALLEATAPLLNMLNGSTMVSNNDLVNLANHAKMTANLLPGDALIRLNASSLTVNQGSLFNVANSSMLNVTGSLVSLANGSALNILNGGLLNVSGNSVANITGSLFSFTGANNSVAVNNSFSVTNTINGISFFQGPGATVNILPTATLRSGTGTGTITGTGPLIIAQGAGTQVTVR
jgi:hypothetical protein